MSVSNSFKDHASDIERKITDWYRHLHRYPELSFKEIETSRWIAERLEEMGIDDVRVGCGDFPSGVVAEIGKEGPTVALRADMDALPVVEDTGLPFESENVGVMHACGHDAHMAILLGAAEILSSRKDSLPGRIRLVFQPSEEASVPQSGADAMVDSGVLDGVDGIFGLHVWQPLESGILGWSDGPLMGSSDFWKVSIEGKGGHGAMPHQTADPTVAAGAFLMALQTIASRQTDPLDSVVVSVGNLRAGEAFNVIPDVVTIEGTARTLSREIRDELPGRIETLAVNTAQAFGCGAKLEYLKNLPPVINDGEMGRRISEVASGLFGEDRVRKIRPTMASEDFSFYLEKVPGAFVFLGMGGEGGADWPHHHPKFRVNESVLADGVSLLSSVAWDFLNKRD
ncbi:MULTISPECIES: M20 metallopeptidase family protein [Dethiosulfovibrio]|uniref:Amidohydrolase n=2 Tax=Dethiosulfovibrio TaxID=47054 RepID=A0ABS9EN67_9BACT|nr:MULTISPECIES: amidohydrolase [Dethiosulfovibrio]MCF4114186.1 amidohydrolase [Dethiosulfovibrio russensis]MCF4142624.1 amidohydrolase [Dethiosulfovibrio marinus]MCF4145143.1 amidohydrolase [Dethiosulfovibrio acidaminovorans]